MDHLVKQRSEIEIWVRDKDLDFSATDKPTSLWDLELSIAFFEILACCLNADADVSHIRIKAGGLGSQAESGLFNLCETMKRR